MERNIFHLIDFGDKANCPVAFDVTSIEQLPFLQSKCMRFALEHFFENNKSVPQKT